MRSALPALLSVFTMACALGGCTAPTAEGTDDPGDIAFLGSPDSKGDGALTKEQIDAAGQRLLDAEFPGGRVRLAQAGVVRAEGGTKYTEDLAYHFGQSVRVMDGFCHSDETLGMSGEDVTDVAIYTLKKPATQLGLLTADTHGQAMAIKVFYKVDGGSTKELPYINCDHPFDIGRTNLNVSYVVLVAPGGTRTGDGDQKFSITLDIVDP
jgi:hypothetical protein